jgi:adenylate kinase
MRVIMLGPPGAGKGTQGERIAGRYGVPRIATGDIFRDEVARQTPLGKTLQSYLDAGDLVPDEVVLNAVMDRVTSAAEHSGGYVLDGFPRTLPQAEAAGRMASGTNASAQAVLYLDAPTEVLIARVTTRGENRADDSETVVRHRLEVYNQHTRPLLEYYTSRGLIVSVDAAPPVDAVSTEIFKDLDRMAG